MSRRQRRASPADPTSAPADAPPGRRAGGLAIEPAGGASPRGYEALKYSSEPMNEAITFSSWAPFCIALTQ